MVGMFTMPSLSRSHVARVVGRGGGIAGATGVPAIGPLLPLVVWLEPDATEIRNTRRRLPPTG